MSPDPKIRAVISDLDMTLIDTRERFYKLFNELLRELMGRNVSQEVFEHYARWDRLNELLGLSDEEAVPFWKEFLSRYSERFDAKPIPGARECLEQLRSSGVSVVVVTGRISPVEAVLKELDRLGMSDLVDEVVTKAHTLDLGDGVYSKERMVSVAVNKVGCSPNQCVVVGDYLDDIRAGKKLGAFTVGVLTGFTHKSLLEREGADAVINSVAELPSMVFGGISASPQRRRSL